ncbi:hypothetical protein CQY20_28915 [Mycolicibacterium agri]|uniref:Uncharacterized protein n=1 Tax=Mycolicibacterium agri TaxID=36811 RepID=A0A2A7MQI7_MYCAG|nr:hypothetical protein [Mycolicibacterium agri]PEG33800.1 hypothetical protein CQY20_28915 [Mycolicibacterium agri]GFG50355.1 hypothetical protein MAGR_17960 [Mycolicibacterium agri]
MSIIPARVHESVQRVDRTYSLVTGIMAGIAAVVALWKIFWLVFTAATLPILGYSGLWLAISLAWWAAIAVLGAFWAVVFLQRYTKQP